MTSLPVWTPDQPVQSGQSILIEASAGTGKTFQTEGLVLRLVCGFMDPAVEPAPVPIERLVIITFTRAAAAELRDRVRARLVRARNVLVSLRTGPLSGKASNDELNQHMASVSEEQREDYLRSIRRALADYDQASISTIHAFCQAMLADHGLAAGLDPGGQEQVDETGLLRRIAADIHAALVIRCSPDALAHLAPNGWVLDKASETLVDNGSKLSPEEMIPSFPDFPAEPTISDVADRMRAPLQQSIADAERLATQLEDWFATADGQVLHAQLCAAKRMGFDHWHDAAAPRQALCAWVRSRGGVQTTQDVQSWLKKLAGLEDHKKPTDEMRTAGAFFAQIQGRMKTSYAPLLAIALHGATRMTRARQKRLGLQTYSSMVRDLADALTAERDQSAHPLRDALRDRFCVALVDEFQDTDNAQWAILREVFLDPPSPGHRLIAVGDPKQSIYRFRGANLGVYEDAKAQIRAQGGRVYRLPRNFRSDSAVMAAFNTLFQDAPWAGDVHASQAGTSAGQAPSGIDYQAVEACKTDWKRIRLQSASSAVESPTGDLALDAPFELRWLAPTTIGQPSLKVIDKGDLKSMAARAAARRIQALLDAGVEVEVSEGSWRPVRADDFAVLTQSHQEARLVATALHRLDIPSIRRDGSSCFKGAATGWVVAWLEAVASPRSEGAARRLALTPLVGWTPHRLDEQVQADGPDWSRLRASLQGHADTWPKQGFGRRFQRFLDAHGALARVLATDDGDVSINDLLTILDACDAESRAERLSPAALAGWVVQQQSAPESIGESPHARTVATDAPSVVLSTLHASKGLQFPIVLVPFSWYERLTENQRDKVIRYSTGLDLKADVRPKEHPGRSNSAAHADVQVRAESMRLLYVALTRARHKAILWGACTKESSAVQRMLKAEPKTRTVADLLGLPDALRSAAIDEPDVYAEAAKDAEDTDTDTDASVPTPLLWSGSIPRTWQNASYSSLSKGAKPKGAPIVDHNDKDSAKPSDPSTLVIQAEVESDETAPEHRHGSILDLDEPSDPALLQPVSWTGAPQGKEAGTWIHGVLEDIVFQPGAGGYVAKDGRPLVQLLTDRAVVDRVSAAVEPAPADRSACPHLVVTDRIEGWLTTPLNGPGLLGLSEGFTLADLSVTDRIDELNFELRVGPGHGTSSSAQSFDARDAALRAALTRAAAGETLDVRTRGWVRRLLARTRPTKQGDGSVQDALTPVLTRFEGFLNGKIDLVFRHGTGADQRFYVADYKTNALTGSDAMKAATQTWAATGEGGAIPRLRRWHYTRGVLAWSMDHSAYHLQSLFYTVALHRFLESRLSDYDPVRHLGGHLYLYLRGMDGPSTMVDEEAHLGVWTDRWPADTIVAFSDALTGPTGGA